MRYPDRLSVRRGGETGRRAVPGSRRGPVRARPPRPEDGSALVEFVLILPLALLVLFGLIDFGFVFQGYTQLRNGVQSGARLASENNVSAFPGSCTAGPDSGGPTSQMVCSIVASIGSPTGLQAGTLAIGISLPPSTNTNSGTTNVDVTVCATGTLNSTSGLLAKLVLGTMSSSSTILTTTSPVSYSPYGTGSTPVKYNGTPVPGKTC